MPIADKNAIRPQHDWRSERELPIHARTPVVRAWIGWPGTKSATSPQMGTVSARATRTEGHVDEIFGWCSSSDRGRSSAIPQRHDRADLPDLRCIGPCIRWRSTGGVGFSCAAATLLGRPEASTHWVTEGNVWPRARHRRPSRPRDRHAQTGDHFLFSCWHDAITLRFRGSGRTCACTPSRRVIGLPCTRW